ncbi:MAG: hypothetical protein VKJ06_08210, partial [Vampirovibrionales bacterium]|nr:hypothetical protein [Vampirovibrionales bacterium]
LKWLGTGKFPEFVGKTTALLLVLGSALTPNMPASSRVQALATAAVTSAIGGRYRAAAKRLMETEWGAQQDLNIGQQQMKVLAEEIKSRENWENSLIKAPTLLAQQNKTNRQ